MNCIQLRIGLVDSLRTRLEPIVSNYGGHTSLVLHGHSKDVAAATQYVSCDFDLTQSFPDTIRMSLKQDGVLLTFKSIEIDLKSK